MPSGSSSHPTATRDDVVIVGAGIGGLTQALALHQAGISCRVYEAAAEILPLGVGINVLPHATVVLRSLGVLDPSRRSAGRAAGRGRDRCRLRRHPLGRSPASKT